MAATATPGVICSRTRILVASADAALRKRILNDPAYANAFGEEAIGGAQALAKLMQFPCDAVLLDQNLPDLDAREVAEQGVDPTKAATDLSRAQVANQATINAAGRILSLPTLLDFL